MMYPMLSDGMAGRISQESPWYIVNFSDWAMSLHRFVLSEFISFPLWVVYFFVL